MGIEKLFTDLESEASYKLDECDKILIVRGYVRGALEQLRAPEKTALELKKIRKKFDV